jgi:molybdopterin molybdotransferase
MALLPVEEAQARVLKGVKPLAAETILLKHAYDRVLASPVKAARDQPPFDASAMDGYAVRQADIARIPAVLTVGGTAAAGHAYRGTVKKGHAIRTLTGAPMPKGADTLVIQENTTRNGSLLTVTAPTPKFKNIRRRGLDFRRGAVLIAAGTPVNARDIGLAAAGNNKTVRVRKAPAVVLFTTGDELVLPGDVPRADQIVSSNSFALEAMARAWGARVTNLGIVKDTLKATETAIRKALAADIVITTGGASVGDHDFVQQALRNCGVKIGFWKIALRPGKPLMFGTYKNTRVLGLPGNPVSALVCARLFLRPLVHRMQDLPADTAPVTARLTAAMTANDNRQDYVRATMSVAPDGTRTVTPYATQDSSMQRTLRDSHCLIIRASHAAAAAEGDTVDILVLDF